MRLLLFDISGGELMTIMLFALLFFGSKGIPDLARTLGRTMRQVRDASNEVQREIQRGSQDVQRSITEQRRAFQQSLEKERREIEGEGAPGSEGGPKTP